MMSIPITPCHRLKVIGHGCGSAAEVITLVGHTEVQIEIPVKLKAVAVLEFILELVLLAETAAMIQIAFEDVGRNRTWKRSSGTASVVVWLVATAVFSSYFRSGPARREREAQQAKRRKKIFHDSWFS